MKSYIPEELLDLFASNNFNNLIEKYFVVNNIDEKKHFQNIFFDDKVKLFKAYITYIYTNLSSDDEKIVYLESIKNEIILIALVSDFINSFMLASLSDREIMEKLGEDKLRLNRLTSFRKHEHYKSLDKYDIKIADIISSEEDIIKRSYRIDFDELISIVKCYIVEEMLSSQDPYDIIDSIDEDDAELVSMVLNAYYIYSKGIKNFDEKKFESKLELLKLSSVIEIAKSFGFLR